MIDVSVNVSESDVADLNRAIDLMITNTRRMGKDAVHRAAYDFIVSAKANTPKSKGKNRTLHEETPKGQETWIQKQKNGKVKIRNSKPSKYYIVRRQGGKPWKILMPNPDLVQGRDRKRKAREVFNELKNKYKHKPNRFAAYNSWNKAFGDLGKTVANTMERRSRRVAMASRAKKLGTKFTPSVRITNDISYLTKIAPGLEGLAMRKAGKSLLKKVDQGLEKQVKRFR